MKKTSDNVEQRIQLKKIEIDNYKSAIKNYPEDRMQKYGIPFLKRLYGELRVLEKELKRSRAASAL